MLRADDSLARARQAQALLGPGVWSEIIRIENTGSTRRYPRTLHALVFEFADLLWFYTATDGTQSFSLHRGRLAEEKADYGPLLRAIEPGFVRWTTVDGGAAPPARGELPNGCFIESLAAWRARVAVGGEAGHPQLVAYYMETRAGLHGHTVLAYEAGGATEVFDPDEPERPRRLAAHLGADPLALSRALAGDTVVKARTLALPVAAAPAFVAVESEAAAAKRGLLLLR